MNTHALDVIGDRWPRDDIVTPESPSLQQAADMVRLDGPSCYRDMLRISQEDSDAIAAYAAANQWEYSQRAVQAPESARGSDVPAWLGQRTAATMSLFAHEISATYRGYGLVMCLDYAPGSWMSESVMDTTVPQGYETVAVARRGVVRVRLSKAFPQLVLDSNKNDNNQVSTLPTSISRTQLTRLEGNFAEHFDFYAPNGLQAEALTVLAPNFMELLMGSSTTFDVEFFGDEMVLVTAEPLYTTRVMKELQTLLDAQLEYLDRLLPSWSYEPSVLPFDRLKTATFNGGVNFKIGTVRFGPAAVIGFIAGTFALACVITLLAHAR